MRLIVILGLAALALSGCAPQYALVPPQRTTVQNVFAVVPGDSWNRWSFSFEKIGPYEQAQAELWNGPVETWVADGYGLDRMIFIGGLAHGASLVKRESESKDPLPVFRDDKIGRAHV